VSLREGTAPGPGPQRPSLSRCFFWKALLFKLIRITQNGRRPTPYGAHRNWTFALVVTPRLPNPTGSYNRGVSGSRSESESEPAVSKSNGRTSGPQPAWLAYMLVSPQGTGLSPQCPTCIYVPARSQAQACGGAVTGPRAMDYGYLVCPVRYVSFWKGPFLDPILAGWSQVFVILAAI
jgi:hypothetical protein